MFLRRRGFICIISGHIYCVGGSCFSTIDGVTLTVRYKRGWYLNKDPEAAVREFSIFNYRRGCSVKMCKYIYEIKTL